MLSTEWTRLAQRVKTSFNSDANIMSSFSTLLEAYWAGPSSACLGLCLGWAFGSVMSAWASNFGPITYRVGSCLLSQTLIIYNKRWNPNMPVGAHGQFTHRAGYSPLIWNLGPCLAQVQIRYVYLWDKIIGLGWAFIHTKRPGVDHLNIGPKNSGKPFHAIKIQYIWAHCKVGFLWTVHLKNIDLKQL